MSSGGSGVCSGDKSVYHRAHAERESLIESIRHADVLALAASYHAGGGLGCHFFREPARGSYNICFFVEFDPAAGSTPDEKSSDDHVHGDQWVVRVPLQPMFGFDVRDKVDSEAATMRLVAERTSIPTPRVIAYATGDESKPIPTFLILEYVQGTVLNTAKLRELTAEQKTTLYEALADVYLQLRRLEFPAIGVLATDGGNESTSTIASGSVVVRSRTVFTVDTNDLQMTGRDPAGVQSQYDEYRDPAGRLTSASAYVSMLLDLADRSQQGWAEVTPENLFNMHTAREFTLDTWLKPEFNAGPFVLTHGDFDGRNILVDDNYNIVAVLDWEWSCVMPLQFLTPPLWLSTTKIDLMAGRAFYNMTARDEFKTLLTIVRSREQAAFSSDQISLADEWDIAKPRGDFFVPYGLIHGHTMDWFASLTIHRLRGKELEKQVMEFMSLDKRRWGAVKKRADANAKAAGAASMLAWMGSGARMVCSKWFAMYRHPPVQGRIVTMTLCGTATACMLAYSLRWCWWAQRQ